MPDFKYVNNFKTFSRNSDKLLKWYNENKRENKEFVETVDHKEYLKTVDSVFNKYKGTLSSLLYRAEGLQNGPADRNYRHDLEIYSKDIDNEIKNLFKRIAKNDEYEVSEFCNTNGVCRKIEELKSEVETNFGETRRGLIKLRREAEIFKNKRIPGIFNIAYNVIAAINTIDIAWTTAISSEIDNLISIEVKCHGYR